MKGSSFGNRCGLDNNRMHGATVVIARFWMWSFVSMQSRQPSRESVGFAWEDFMQQCDSTIINTPFWHIYSINAALWEHKRHELIETVSQGTRFVNKAKGGPVNVCWVVVQHLKAGKHISWLSFSDSLTRSWVRTGGHWCNVYCLHMCFRIMTCYLSLCLAIWVCHVGGSSWFLCKTPI